MASTEIRDRRRTSRYRNLVLKQMVQMKNRVSGLLMEGGVSDDKRRLHKMGYFSELFSSNEEISKSIRPLLRLGREHIQRAQRLDRALTASLERDQLPSEEMAAEAVARKTFPNKERRTTGLFDAQAARFCS
jgi:transposase